MEVPPEAKERNRQFILGLAKILGPELKKCATPNEALGCLEILLDYHNKLLGLRVAREKIQYVLIAQALFPDEEKAQQPQEREALPADFDIRVHAASQRLSELVREKRISLILSQLIMEILHNQKGHSMTKVRMELQSLFKDIQEDRPIDPTIVGDFDSPYGVLNSCELELAAKRRGLHDLAACAVGYAIRSCNPSNSILFEAGEPYVLFMHQAQFKPIIMDSAVKNFIEKRFRKIDLMISVGHARPSKVVYLEFDEPSAKPPRWMALHVDPKTNQIREYHYVTVHSHIPEQGDQEESDSRWNTATLTYSDDSQPIGSGDGAASDDEPSAKEKRKKNGFWERVRRWVGF